MRAIVVREFGGPDVMRLEDVAPTPAVARRKCWCACEPPASILSTRTFAPALTPEADRSRTRRASDGAGEVEAVGADVKGFKPAIASTSRTTTSRLAAHRGLCGARALRAEPAASSSRQRVVRAGRRDRRPLRDGVSRLVQTREGAARAKPCWCTARAEASASRPCKSAGRTA